MIFTQDRVVVAPEVTSISLNYTVADNLNKTAELSWNAGAENGNISTDLYYTRSGMAGFLLNRKEKGFHAKFENVSISGKDFTATDFNINEVYQYSSFNGLTCIWDGNGNLTTWGSNFQYDAFNRMVKAGNVTYLYDAQNRRVAKIDDLGVHQYIYHGWSVIAEYLNGTLQREFIEGLSIDEHLCMRDAASGQMYYYVLDTRNGVDKIVDVAGQVVEEYK